MDPDDRQPAERGLSWWALLLGLAFGIAAALVYTWEIDPVIERNTAPWQLSEADREDYVIAVALSYTANQDLALAFDRLRALRPSQDVWSLVADIACNRIKTGQVVTNNDIRVIRALEGLYRPQGASGCADGQYPTPAPVTLSAPVASATPSPTLPPPPTKTPTPPRPTDIPQMGTIIPTRTPPSGGYVLSRLESFCNPAASGVIEIRVYDRLGQGVPGVRVSVTWSGNERDSFFTGLKPEREAGYADFQMTEGRTYTVMVPGLTGDPRSVEAVPCEATVDGEQVTALTSYRVNFTQNAN